MRSLAIIDGFGVYGNYLHYALVIAFVGSAFILFIYLWWKDRLDMDESAKFEMMDQNQEHKSEKYYGKRDK